MQWILAVLGLLIGSAAGAAIGWLFADRRSRLELSQHAASLAREQQRADGLAEQLQATAASLEQLRTHCGKIEQENAAIQAQLTTTQQSLTEQKKLLDDAQVKLRDAFASVSSEALAKNNEAFLQLADQKFAKLSAQATGSLDERKLQIEAMLKPMRELLNQYQQRLGEIEKQRVESYGKLQSQVGTLTETERALQQQTNQLVTALRRPGTRGRWGEVALKRLVELAGMTDHCDFKEQVSTQTEEGRLRPDMIVYLPEGRQVIVDSKAVVDASLDAAAAQDEQQRQAHLARHARNIRQRAQELSKKAYWDQFDKAPAFVIMFLPAESFLYAAVEQDPDLIEQCIQNRVIIATPTTLIAMLRSIEYGWRQQRIADNAETIRKLGAELYDRLAIFINYFTDLGSALTRTVKTYNDAIGSLESRLLPTARKMTELGVPESRAIKESSPIDLQPRELTSQPE